MKVGGDLLVRDEDDCYGNLETLKSVFKKGKEL